MQTERVFPSLNLFIRIQQEKLNYVHSVHKDLCSAKIMYEFGFFSDTYLKYLANLKPYIL